MHRAPDTTRCTGRDTASHTARRHRRACRRHDTEEERRRRQRQDRGRRHPRDSGLHRPHRRPPPPPPLLCRAALCLMHCSVCRPAKPARCCCAPMLLSLRRCAVQHPCRPWTTMMAATLRCSYCPCTCFSTRPFHSSHRPPPLLWPHHRDRARRIVAARTPPQPRTACPLLLPLLVSSLLATSITRCNPVA